LLPEPATDFEGLSPGLDVPTNRLFREGSLCVSASGFSLPATGLGDVDRTRLK
jgi:hypothetical protein